MPSEAQARITINKLLEGAGWRFLPDAQGRREDIVCEHRVTRGVFPPSQDLGNDFQHAPNGFVDYVLLNTDQRPVAVTEAKREGIDPLTGKEQARSYAESLGVSHIFLSNGLVHYYWNLLIRICFCASARTQRCAGEPRSAKRLHVFFDYT